jgi:hypothetical protein
MLSMLLVGLFCFPALTTTASACGGFWLSPNRFFSQGGHGTLYADFYGCAYELNSTPDWVYGLSIDWRIPVGYEEWDFWVDENFGDTRVGSITIDTYVYTGSGWLFDETVEAYIQQFGSELSLIALKSVTSPMSFTASSKDQISKTWVWIANAQWHADPYDLQRKRIFLL